MAYTERYASVTGAGTHNGESEANAWTLAEMLTNLTAGQRGNLISGAYSSGADVMTNSGTQVSMIAVRGYNSTIGDLETQGHNSDGTLDDTNFPVITVTGILGTSARNLWQNISVTGAVGSYNFGSTGTDYVTLISCKFTQSGAGTNVLGDNNWTLIDCEIESTASSHSNVIAIDAYSTVIGCRIKGAATSGSSLMLTAVSLTCLNSIFIGTTSLVGVNIESTGQPSVLANNTIYNCGTAVQLVDAIITAIPVLINNHVTDCTEYIDALYSTTANSAIIEVYNRTRDNTTPRTGIGDGVNIGEVTTDTGGIATDFVDASNGDFTLIAAAPGVDAGMGM